MKLFKNRTDPRFTAFDTVFLSACLLMFIFGGAWLLMAGHEVTFMPSFYGWMLYFIGAIILGKKAREKGVIHTVMNIIRTAGIALILSGIMLAVILLGFEKVPLLYPVKRYIFTNGVRNIEDELLPRSMPPLTQKGGYYFRTEGSFPAQDYRPYAYLFIYTDEPALKNYEQMMSQNISYTKTDAVFVKNTDTYALCPDALPHHVYDRLLSSGIQTGALSDAVLWMGDDGSMWNSYSGAMIDYKDDLLVVWR